MCHSDEEPHKARLPAGRLRPLVVVVRGGGQEEDDRPDVRLDAVARPVLPRRHVDQQPAHGSIATATNLRASTAPTWSTRGPHLVDASAHLVDASHLPGRRATCTWPTHRTQGPKPEVNLTARAAGDVL
jgi:hypothetical protein